VLTTNDLNSATIKDVSELMYQISTHWKITQGPAGANTGRKGIKMIRTIIQLPEDMHKQLREIATKETLETGKQVSISEICRRAIEQYLSKN